MGNQEMNELFYGKDIVAETELFQMELATAEQKHTEYFKAKSPTRQSEEQERLSFHYINYTANGQVMFNFLPESDFLKT